MIPLNTILDCNRQLVNDIVDRVGCGREIAIIAANNPIVEMESDRIWFRINFGNVEHYRFGYLLNQSKSFKLSIVQRAFGGAVWGNFWVARNIKFDSTSSRN